ncbi:MAG TPA: class I SAM-dependent RNA methyltransferase [Anaerolineae bacterium]|nr:class I SAM-dependent RNA methyltransferase [Anaerolineae bacterium]
MQRRNEAGNSTVVLRLESMTYGGDALGRADGKAIFVQGGIAGEQVRAAIIEERGRFARARVVEVLEPSPDRIEPRCAHFGFTATACGGCQWQHIAYAAQLRFKAEIVREQLRRIGRIDAAPVRETIPGPAWSYRNHAQFSVAPEGRLGFQAARSKRVVAIDECHVVETPIAEWLKSARRRHTDRVEVRVANGEYEGVGVWESNLQSPTSTFQIKDAAFRVSAESFFQVNTALLETLVDQVSSKLDVHSGETVVDAYCGVGLFTHFIAPLAGQAIGIESSPSAIADARANLAQFENVELREGLVEDEFLGIGDSIDAVVLDPPRAGCGPKVIAALSERPVKRLVYVSCDPATLARDARQLLDGGYDLIEVQPVDMFPQTYHIEAIALFLRQDVKREA